MKKREDPSDDDAKSVSPSSAGSEDNLKNLEWTDNLEALMARWSDEALTYAWLHVKSESKFRKLNYSFTIPIVILSTVTGSINLAMSSMIPPQYNSLGNLATGALSIFTGILGTLLNFFKYAQISEAHRNATVQWHKFYRHIKTELALDRNCRKSAPTFYAAAKSEMDRLLDSSPNIPSEITQRYEERTDVEVELPDIIGNIHRTRVYRGSANTLLNIDDLSNIADLREYQHSPMNQAVSSIPTIHVKNPLAKGINDDIKDRIRDGIKGGIKDVIQNALYNEVEEEKRKEPKE